MTDLLHYPLADAPHAGESVEVAPGVWWVRMPLPFKLDHINLWLLEDRGGWTIVDTGINRPEVASLWRTIEERVLGGGVRRVIVTHFHPDHIGLAGWLCERHGCPMWVTAAELAASRRLLGEQEADYVARLRTFYRQAGFDRALLENVNARGNMYARSVAPLPEDVRLIVDGETFEIDGRTWRVVVGRGHSPEHACLVCDELSVLISGDQVLPRITPNVSVNPYAPDADPLDEFLSSLDRLRAITDSVLVLPSHKMPFVGLHLRIDALRRHHEERLEETREACAGGATGLDILRHLFRRPLDRHQLFFAIGESLAHVHRLIGEGAVMRERDDAGVHRYRLM